MGKERLKGGLGKEKNFGINQGGQELAIRELKSFDHGGKKAKMQPKKQKRNREKGKKGSLETLGQNEICQGYLSQHWGRKGEKKQMSRGGG